MQFENQRTEFKLKLTDQLEKDVVEHIGSGIPRILKKYDHSIFNFTTNFQRVILTYPTTVIDRNNKIESIADINSADIINTKSTDRVPTHAMVTNNNVVNLHGVKATRAKIILRQMVEHNIFEARGEK
jgi:hypothetical protein